MHVHAGMFHEVMMMSLWCHHNDINICSAIPFCEVTRFICKNARQESSKF